MAKDYKKLAADIVGKIGGEENVISLAHCMTRLRFILKDESKANKKALEQTAGVIQVLIAGGQYQVVIGTDVGDVYDAIGEVTKINLGGSADTEKGNTDSRKGIGTVINVISGIFMPFLGAFMAVGLLKGLLVLLTTLNLLDATGTTYRILFSMADGFFQFLPIFIAYTAGSKFGANPFVSMAVAAALVYPDITAMFNGSDPVTFFGLPVTLISYPCSVIPMIAATFVQAKLEKGLKRIIPQVLRGILVPVISVVLISLLTFLVIGPVSDVISTVLANGINTLLGICPPVAGFIFGLLYPLMIIFGFHWGLVPIVMNSISALGYESLFCITWAANFAIAGCSLGIFLKTRNQELKQVSGSAFASSFLGGVTEPAIYGCLLKYKRPYVIVCLMTGIGGIVLASAGVTEPVLLSVCALTIPALVACGGLAAVAAIGIGLFGGIVLTYLVGFNDKMLEG